MNALVFMITSKLVRVLLNPSTSAPPPIPDEADSLAIPSAMPPVTPRRTLLPITLPSAPAAKKDII